MGSGASSPSLQPTDPQQRTLEVFELQGEKWQYQYSFTDGDVCALPSSDDSVLTMAELFRPLPKGWPDRGELWATGLSRAGVNRDPPPRMHYRLSSVPRH